MGIAPLYDQPAYGRGWPRYDRTAAFNFYLDAAAGNDANDGKTPATAWATLGHLASLAAPSASGDLTLSATAGTVTATRSSGTFTEDDLGKWLADGDGDGYGEIVGVDGTSSCTLRIDSTFASTSPGQFELHRFGPRGYRIRVRGDFTDDPFNAIRSHMTDVHLRLVCDQPGTIKQSAENTDSMSAFSIGGGPWKFEVLGHNNLTIQDFVNGTGNGFGANNDAHAILCDTTIIGCIDGCSSHATALVETFRCHISACLKGAIVDANTATSKHHGTTCVEVAGGSSFALLSFVNPNSLFEDGTLEPDASGGQIKLDGGTLRRSRVGTLTVRTVIQSVGAKGKVRDSFLNASIDGNQLVDLGSVVDPAGDPGGNYGYLTTRHRDSGDIHGSHCDFRGGASGDTDSILHRNFDATSQGGWVWIDAIFTGYSATCVGQNYNTEEAQEFEAAGNSATYICYHDNGTNVHAEIEATTADVSTGVIEADPLLGPGGTYDKDDWGVLDGSPCIGAASHGGDIGFRTAA